MLQTIFLIASCFYLKRSAKYVNGIGADFFDLVKTNTKGIYKGIFENMMSNWEGGSYVLFDNKEMVIKDTMPVVIGYKHNSWKVLSFITTKGEGITKTVFAYLSNYSD